MKSDREISLSFFLDLSMERIDPNPANNCHTLGLDRMTELGKSQTSLLSGISDETNLSSTEVSD